MRCEESLCTSMGETDGRDALDCRDFSIKSLSVSLAPSLAVLPTESERCAAAAMAMAT